MDSGKRADAGRWREGIMLSSKDEPIHATFNGQLWLQDVSWAEVTIQLITSFCQRNPLDAAASRPAGGEPWLSYAQVVRQ